MFNQLFEQVIQELNFNGVMRKAASITKLFPTFRKRVRDVAAAGGVTLIEMLPEVWHFKVPSSNKEKNGVDYDVYVRFKNLEEIIKKYAIDRRLWNQAQDNVDYRKLSAEVINNVDLETSCSCPATLYWGQDFIRTQRKAQYGEQENRPPNIRNPRQYGALCKHGENVFEVLPMYTVTFASFLKKFWNEEIVDAMEGSKKELTGIQKAAAELGKKAEEKPVAYARGGKKVPVGTAPGVPEENPEEMQPPEEELVGVAPKVGTQINKTNIKPATQAATKQVNNRNNKSATRRVTK